MDTEMALNFSPDEKKRFKCNIFDQDIDPNNLDESALPTDIHLVEYEIDGKLYVDSMMQHSHGVFIAGIAFLASENHISSYIKIIYLSSLVSKT